MPIAKSMTCCLIIPIAAMLALVLEQKSTNTLRLTEKRAALLGIFTGLYAALFGTSFDVIITLITHNNDIISAYSDLPRFLEQLPFDDQVNKEVTSLFARVVNDIKETGFSIHYTTAIIINNFLVNTLFGLIGGLVGNQILKKRSAGQ